MTTGTPFRVHLIKEQDAPRSKTLKMLTATEAVLQLVDTTDPEWKEIVKDCFSLIQILIAAPASDVTLKSALMQLSEAPDFVIR